MPLSDQDRDRIREEEWVRLQAREDFYKQNGGLSWGPRYGWGRRKHPGYFLAFVGIVAFAAVLISVAERINWDGLLH